MSATARVVDGGDARAVFEALRGALRGNAPAVFPRENSDPLPAASVPRGTALIVETSGSTGAPKRVLLSAAALQASAEASALALGGTGQWLLALPAHYIAGAQVLVRSLLAGTEPVVLAPGHFDAQRFADAAGRLDGRLRFTSLVPVQLARVVEAVEADATVAAAARRFDRILLGGQAAPPALLDRAAELDLRVTRTYGSSETAGGCVYDGRPIGDAEIAIVDGVVQLSGPTLATGYLGDPQLTAAAFSERDGRRWYRTGDLGELGSDGSLRILGRADNVIISGAEKVSLDAVEAVVRALPGMTDAVAVAAADPEWGQAPVIVVVERSGQPGLAEVRRMLGERLGVAARPVRVQPVERIPLLPSGKPDRRALSDLVAASPH